jgi:hypothetical protein
MRNTQELIYPITVRPQNTDDAVEITLRLTYEQTQRATADTRLDPGTAAEYEWYKVEIEARRRSGGRFISHWIDITEAPSIDDLLSIERDSGRLDSWMDDAWDDAPNDSDRAYDEARDRAAEEGR